MNKTRNKVPTRFGPETRFAVVPAPAAPFRRTHENALERLKGQLLRERLAATPVPEAFAPLRRASNEAAALAWASGYPLLLLPELFREKAETAVRYARRQTTLLKPKRQETSEMVQVHAA